ncbi:MAG: hypothetical protein JW991_03935 [Candidatus Pacebacteria bacterium]|nr:hypothetical protein [Candidatus Paceibacterota bacterium]
MIIHGGLIEYIRRPVIREIKAAFYARDNFMGDASARCWHYDQAANHRDLIEKQKY